MNSCDEKVAIMTHANPAALTEKRTLHCDSYGTGLNNNILVLGPSGSGKTRDVLKPNLLQMESSFLVLESRGLLCREVGPLLASHGYDVQSLNLAELSENIDSSENVDTYVGYNPLAHIRRSAETGVANQQDILSVSRAICSSGYMRDPPCESLALNCLNCLIAYVLEELPAREQHLGSVMRLVQEMGTGGTERLMDELEVTRKEGYAFTAWQRFISASRDERSFSPAIAHLCVRLACFSLDGALRLYTTPRQLDFARMGHERVALFVRVSDVDHSLDALTSLFVTQAIQGLVREADLCSGGCLPVPVRLMFDNFATLTIPSFVDSVAVLQSRKIWITILLQTVSQLEQRYGATGAQTIAGSCDLHLVLAFQDTETATWYTEHANRPTSSLFTASPDKAWLFVRGRPGKKVSRYRLEEHPLYQEMLDATKESER